MNKIDIIRKLSSRKFWALVSALAVTVTSIVFSEAVAVHVASIIAAVSACVTYIFAEASVDAARLSSEQDDGGSCQIK